MRGKGQCYRDSSIVAGITPAYAGKRCRGSVPGSCTRDHPRLCGEKLYLLAILDGSGGSPPPMRGKGLLEIVPCVTSRITPAYAGKRGNVLPRNPGSQDHPRLCGEKDRGNHEPCIFKGSPPPMRGKVVSGFSLTSVYRITPAYAGKRAFRAAAPVLAWDHPRLCGEKTVCTASSMI